MRIILAAAALVLTSGCAVLAPADRQAARTVIYSDGDLEPASAVVRVADGAPVGLTPCKKKSFPARDCWRRGDQHVLFPPTVTTAGMPLSSESIPVSGKR